MGSIDSGYSTNKEASAEPDQNDLNSNASTLWRYAENTADNKTLQLVVSDVHNPETFHVQILSEVDAINDFCFNLDSFYKQLEVDKKLNELLFPANQCKIGVFVAAVYAHDNCWYRAQIIEFLTLSHVKIKFVDYGTCIDVAKSKLYFLKSPFTISDMKVSAYPAKLHGIKPIGSSNWKKKNSERFQELVGCRKGDYSRELVGTIVCEDLSKQPIELNFSDDGEDKRSIAEILVSEDHACWVDSDGVDLKEVSKDYKLVLLLESMSKMDLEIKDSRALQELKVNFDKLEKDFVNMTPENVEDFMEKQMFVINQAVGLCSDAYFIQQSNKELEDSASTK